MAEVIYPFLRGFIVPDTRFNRENLATPLPPEADPEPGTVRHSDNRSALVLETSGEQSKAFDAEVTRAGNPGTSALAVLIRDEGAAPSADGDVIWNPPNQLTDNRAFEFKDSGTALPYAGAAVYPDTEDVIFVAASGGRVWDTSAKDWVGAVGHAPAGHATLVLPDGRALVFRIVTAGVNFSADVDAYDIETDTITTYATDALLAVLAGAPLRVGVAEQNGNIVLFIDDGTTLFQFASSDVGTNFSLIMSTAVDWTAGANVFVLPSGRFMVVYQDLDFARARIIADPFEPFDTVPVQDINLILDVDDAITACVDADGIVYVFAREELTGAGGSIVRGFFTVNEGTTWLGFTSPPLDTREGDSSLIPFACARHRGQMALIGGLDSIGTGGFNFDGESLIVLFLGGWESSQTDAKSSTDVGIGTARIAGAVGSGDSEGISWYATDFSATFSSLTGVGAGTRLMQTTFNSVEILHEAFFADAGTSFPLNNSALIRWEGFVRAGGLQTAADVFLEADTALKGMQIFMDRAGFSVRNHAGASLGGDATFALTEALPGQFIIHIGGIADAELTVLYKRPWDTEWRSITATLTGTLGTNRFFYGVSATAGGEMGTNNFWAISDTGAGRRWIVRSSIAGDVWDDATGKYIGIRPYPLGELAANGGPTYLRAKDGPGFTGEVQTLALTHKAPVHRIFTDASPSPDEPHKTGVETEVIYEWDFGELHLIGNSTSGGALIAFPTWRTATFEFFLGIFQTVATINMSEGMESLSWLRNGHQVRINGGTGARYVRRNEYAGGYFHFDNQGGAIPVRRILSNTEGTLGSTGRIPRFFLEGDVSAINTSGVAGRLCATSAVMIWHELADSGYTRYRLRIDAQNTAEGSIDTGLFLPGGLAVPGRQYSRAYSRETLPNSSVIVDDQGTSRVTRRGRSFRRWAIAYSDGLILQSLQGPTPTPDYIAARAGEDALATRHDVADLYDGLIEETKSSQTPLVLVTDIPLSTGALGSGLNHKQVHGRNSHLYCRIASSIRFDHQDGTEDENEMGRLQVIALNEVI